MSTRAGERLAPAGCPPLLASGLLFPCGTPAVTAQEPLGALC
jgi:hypothetical protein